MVLNFRDQFDATKTDLYRSELGQAPVDAQTNETSSPAMYCQNMVDIQTPFLAANQDLLATGQSPVTGVGDNLFTFLANRLNMSFTNLACQNYGLTNPVTVTMNGGGAAIAATFNTTKQTATSTVTEPAMPGSGMPGSSQRMGRSHHQLMNPSAMGAPLTKNNTTHDQTGGRPADRASSCQGDQSEAEATHRPMRR